MTKHTGHGHGGHGGHGDQGQEQGHGHAPHDHAHGHEDGDFDWDVMGPRLEQEAELGLGQYGEAARWVAGLPATGVRRVLDVGSGPGVITCLLAEVFPDAEIVAVDGNPALLERTRARAERLGLGDRVRILHAELPDDLDTLGEADLIWAANSLHHMGDQRGVLAGFAGLLRPGGAVALLEGGLPTRHLPRDIGFGRAGLEARIDAVTANWFADMRAALPDARQETENWNALFGSVGLKPQGTRSFLLDLPGPLSGPAREHVVDSFARTREVLAGGLAQEDIAAIDRLLDPDDPAGLHRRDDVFLLSARTVHVAGRV